MNPLPPFSTTSTLKLNWLRLQNSIKIASTIFDRTSTPYHLELAATAGMLIMRNGAETEYLSTISLADGSVPPYGGPYRALLYISRKAIRGRDQNQSERLLVTTAT